MRVRICSAAVIALIMGLVALPGSVQARITSPQGELAGIVCVTLPAIGQGTATLVMLGAKADAVRCPTSYTVRYGETLYSIAARCGIAAATLQQANGLRTDRLWTGQRLYVPTPKVSAAKPAAVTPVTRTTRP